MNSIWLLLTNVRTAVKARVDFLEIKDTNTNNNNNLDTSLSVLPWVEYRDKNINKNSNKNSNTTENSRKNSTEKLNENEKPRKNSIGKSNDKINEKLNDKVGVENDTVKSPVLLKLTEMYDEGTRRKTIIKVE